MPSYSAILVIDYLKVFDVKILNLFSAGYIWNYSGISVKQTFFDGLFEEKQDFLSLSKKRPVKKNEFVIFR